MLSLSRENEPSYYRRRRIEEQPIRTRTQRRQPSRFTRLKNVTLNWLNGLPPTDYDSALDEFQSERVEAEESFPEDLQKLGTDRSGSDAVNDDGDLDNPVSRKRKGLRKKLARLRSLLALSKKNAGESEMETNRADQFNAVAIPPENDFQDEKLLLQSPDTKIRVQQLEETGFVETRPSIREIVLPPDYLGQRNFLRYAAQLRPKLRRKFLEAHPWTISNQIRTAKYTVLTFLPKNLFEQFRRAANVYFLLLIVLQAIPIFSNTNPFLAASPLVCILALTAIKDAIEDWKRQKSDVVVNHAITWVLKRGDVESMANDTTIKSFGEMLKSVCTTGYQAVLRVFTPRVKIPKIPGTPAGQSGRNYWRQTYWKDVRVGDIILIKNNEMIPADVVVLSTSDQQGICYVETKNLDGETNLKIRQAPSKTSWIQTPDQAASFSALVQVEPPSTRLYTFAGKLLVNMEDARGDSRSANDQFIEMSTDALPINHEGLLLRGCQIRNTEHVIGVVAYTGIHTKIIMNSGMTPSKRSRIERQMNPQIILSFALLFIICITCAIMQGQYVGGAIASAPYWYTVYNTGIFASPIFTGFLTFWSSLILFQTLVPISLYITVEVCKLVQAYFIHVDAQMYYTDRDQRAVPRSWNIADDLGQIQYIFSDKTGTLTRNVMEFRRCSINGKIYGCLPVHRAQRGLMGHKSQEETGFVSEEGHSQMEADMIEHLGRLLPYKYVPPLELSFVDTALLEDICEQGPDLRGKKVCDFFFMIIVCHTILIDKLGMTEEAVASTEEGLLESDISPHLLQYQAQSPDEAALVKAARDLGFVFLSRDCNYLNLLVLGQPERVEILNVIEFNSTRKRMSVIVRRENGEVWLFCKGADSVIYERLKSCADAMGSCMEAQTLNHLESFAEAGLRTLCFASRKLTEGEYESFALRHQEASMAMSNRELLMDAVAEEYEKELVLAGATAIEDRLQDGVPETISTLQKAGIKIWVLTGDKMETAVNIGFSCQLLRKDMFLIMVRSDDQTVEGTKKQLDEGYRRMLRSLDHLNSENWGAATEPSADGYAEGEGNLEYALIIDGVSLKHALDDRDCRPLFLDLATNCRAVLCCRVSPLQKAKVVELVKRTSNCMTLAIGDGANDVSMIQEADVGVGIAGEEGMQAVMSSDYAISQFSYLKRLLLVHGRLSYVRTAKITLLCFCKNVSFVLVAFWYQIYCAFTAQYAYDYMYLLYFNMIFTMLPVLLLGMLDRQVADDKLTGVPQLYNDGIKQRYYSMKLFLLYSATAIYQSLVCYFLPQLIFTDTAVISYGFPESKTMLGNVEGFASILSINAFIAMHMQHWNWIFVVGLVLSLLVFIAFTVVYLMVPISEMYGSWGDFVEVRFWGALVLTFTVALLPSFLIPFAWGWICPRKPRDVDLVREIEHESWLAQRKAKARGETAHGHVSDVEALEPLSLEEQLAATVRAQEARDEATWWNRMMKDRWTLRGSHDVAVPDRLLVTHRPGRSRTPTTLSVGSLSEFAADDPMKGEIALGVNPPTIRADSAYSDCNTNNSNNNNNNSSDDDHMAVGRVDRAKRQPSRLLRKWKTSTFRFFNLRTGAMEDAHGFAFSQERGSGQLIAGSPRPRVQPHEDVLGKRDDCCPTEPQAALLRGD